MTESTEVETREGFCFTCNKRVDYVLSDPQPFGPEDEKAREWRCPNCGMIWLTGI